MPSKGFGWVHWGATGNSPLPTNVRQLQLALAIVANDEGFYWAVTPGREVIKTVASGSEIDELVCHLDVEGVPRDQVRWADPFMVLDPSIPAENYRLSRAGESRRLELLPPLPDGIYPFKFRVEYLYQRKWTPCELDPEIDLGMESPPS